MHVVASFVSWTYFPLAKLVHLWSAPLDHLVRPRTSMRRYESLYPEGWTSERK